MVFILVSSLDRPAIQSMSLVDLYFSPSFILAIGYTSTIWERILALLLLTSMALLPRKSFMSAQSSPNTLSSTGVYATAHRILHLPDRTVLLAVVRRRRMCDEQVVKEVRRLGLAIPRARNQTQEEADAAYQRFTDGRPHDVSHDVAFDEKCKQLVAFKETMDMAMFPRTNLRTNHLAHG
mmetsp:Transcript_37139/g.81339  ORF Transcript_37139/g.81339 Transcript_37139/m.81339 type:complete len:180 (-) Transcript_37139:189-728(-)